MERFLIYLTFPGFGGRSTPAPPPPPAAPPPAPTPVDASQSRQAADSRRQELLQQGLGGTVRNVGGARGLPTPAAVRSAGGDQLTGAVRNVGGARGRGMGVTETARALKSLTGM